VPEGDGAAVAAASAGHGQDLRRVDGGGVQHQVRTWDVGMLGCWDGMV
jgi:hypothetical protein